MLGVLACASPAPPWGSVRPAFETVAILSETLEDQAAPHDRVAQALEDLAQARRRLLGGETEAGLVLLEEARDHLEQARTLLPQEWILLKIPGRAEPLRVVKPQPPLIVPLSVLRPETLESLRPYRLSGAHGLRVDLDLLERRLERALERPPDRALGEVFLAAGTALRLERGSTSHLANGTGEPEPPCGNSEDAAERSG